MSDWLHRVRIFRWLLADIRRRVELVYSSDERAMRRHETTHFLVIMLAFVSLWTLVLLISRDPFVFLLLLCATLYLYGMFQDLLIYRLESKLLLQLTELLANVRHQYHRHRMVLEALTEGAEQSKRMAQMHALRIVDCLRAHHPEEELGGYYERAPNRYLQALAGLSFIVFEYGDREEGKGSFYLQALAHLQTEVELDRIRRNRLSYLLQSLQTITLAPLLALTPLQDWASSQFPRMSEFYESGKGFLFKIFIYMLVLVCFVLVRQMQSLEQKPAVQRKRQTWQERLLKRNWLRWLMEGWMPPGNGMKREWLSQLLLSLEGDGNVARLYARRLVLAFVAFTSSLAVVLLALHYEQLPFQGRYLLICVFIAGIGYLVPLAMLLYKRRLQRMSLKYELEQFQLLLSLLAPMERMDVPTVMHWLERFAHHFKRPFQMCLIAYPSGGWKALEELKEQTGFPPLSRVIEKLQEAVERLELSDAFDDLVSDREYMQEQRKHEFEKMIASKVLLGKIIGFVPLYASVFIYLMFPMMYVSATQMQSYYQQLQGI